VLLRIFSTKTSTVESCAEYGDASLPLIPSLYTKLASNEEEDPAVLERAVREERIVVSHDYSTMRAYAEERLRAGLPMMGLFLVRQESSIGRVIDELVLIAEATAAEEWQGKIVFLPL
jgi:hypothetical protein